MSEKSGENDSRDYPVREDMGFQLKVWRFERWGWCFMVLMVILTLLGMFSRGPLSSREAVSNDGRIRVQYEVFHRNGSVNPMIIQLQAPANTPVELEFAGDVMQGFSIETLQPQPLRSVSAGDGMKLWLQTDAAGQASVYLRLRGEGLGLYNSRFVMPGAEPLSLGQFIYP